MPGQSIETITLEQAMELFKLPRTIGSHEGEPLVVNIGPYGPYVFFKKKFYSVPKNEDLFAIGLERCLEIIDEKIAKDEAKKPILLGKHNNVDVMAAVGRYGPYIAYNGHFYKLPADTSIAKVKLQEAIDIIRQTDEKNTVKSFTEDKDLKIMKAKTGKYITYKNENYKIPRNQANADLSYEDCMQIIQNANTKKK
jgi:DNA topoisomerase-1